MPELPEVETIVRDLNKVILNRKIEDVWSDWKKSIKNPKNFSEFKRKIKNEKIKKVWRRGKNIILNLSNNKILLIHQKMTGHLLYGNWELINKEWISKQEGPLKDDSRNKFLHFIIFLDNKKQLALSDARKFAKIELWDKETFENSKSIKSLGPEPLDKNFTFDKFKQIFKNKKKRIKSALMDQNLIAGIGNIYADEILWKTKINPHVIISNLNDKQLKDIYRAIKEILLKSIKLGGTSISDFRRISGEKGFFEKERKVYQRKGENCQRCKTKIKRIKLGGRGTYFCPVCQKE